MPDDKTSSVLYLSYDGLTDPLGESQILPYLSGLSRLGHRISIISFEKKDRYVRERERVKALCENAGIAWYPQMYHKTPPIFSTLYDLLVMRRGASTLLKTHNVDVVHCRSYLAPLIGFWLKRKFGTRVIFDMRGFWADERVEGGLWNRDNPIYRFVYGFFKRKEQEFLSKADHVVVLTDEGRQVLDSWGFRKNISVIPCCVDLNLFSRASTRQGDIDALRAELNIKPGAFVLLYIGSIGTWYLWEDMMRFFRSIRETVSEACFVVLTPDVDRVPADPGVVVRTVPRQQVPHYIAMASASVCFIKPSFSKKGSSATKMAEVLAMGVPVFVNEGWGDVSYLKNKVSGLAVVNVHDRYTPQMLPEVAGPGEFFFSMFSLEEGVRRYDHIYQSLAKA